MIVTGDFNLDYTKYHSLDYTNKNLCNVLLDIFDPMSLIQLINFPTWSRIVHNILKESTLDHVYTNDSTLVENITSVTPLGGDHKIITFTTFGICAPPLPILKRDWKNYSKESLINKLNLVNWQIEADDVQSYWNIFESKLLAVVDELVPYKIYNNVETNSCHKPQFIKNILSERKSLLKIFNKYKHVSIKTKIKSLDAQVRKFFRNQKRNSIRRKIFPNNSKTLWDAVKTAKNLNLAQIPDNLTLTNIEVPKKSIPEAFALFFREKVEKIVNEAVINENVYNGKCKVEVPNDNFMSQNAVGECINDIKIKNNEGFDRIPQRIIVDGCVSLLPPLSILFNKIYNQMKLPEQWLTSKITPILKKGNKHTIENYRPIANLCSASKFFEKLILRQIHKIQEANDIDLTGNAQHGFKKHKSTATAGLTIQSLLSRALDQNNYAIMASLDLSAAFDVINVNLLIERLKIMGLPADIVDLIRAWLSTRHCYVTVNNDCSDFWTSNTGTVQGSILGPFLYAIYVSPLFDLKALTNFADDNFVIRSNINLQALVAELENDLKVIVTWLRDSGLKVNENKTEICLFHRLDVRSVSVNVGANQITSSSTMNVLGVSFDSKMQWSSQVSNTIKKAKSALHAISIIKKYFNPKELLTLLTSNFYSILFYNSEIWYIPSLNPYLKNQLKSASANALKICTPSYHRFMSYETLHKINNRALPDQMMLYKHALMLFKLYQFHTPTTEWIELQHSQILTTRQTQFEVCSPTLYAVGKNILTHRLTVLNRKIDLCWMNLSIDSFKVKCKERFLA